MKKVAVIQDLSSFGKCSLTAAIPVLSVMGVQACPLPTAILSAQTEYPSFFCEDLTANMPLFIKEWHNLHEHFEGIHTGFITGKEQITHILSFLDMFHKEGTTLLVDPVMGDVGSAYTNFDEELLEQMKVLVKRANIVTPNLTECCLLTGLSYSSLDRFGNEKDFLKKVEEAGLQLAQETGAQVIITGINPPAGPTNTQSIGNMYIDSKHSIYSSIPYNGRSYSGTGDLFASVIMGSLMRGETLIQAIHLAETFLTAAIQDTCLEKTPTMAGVNFEKFLRLLL
ncbi:pyridoxamine kinase [Sporosarcina sp. GW1-11]|uniref:pyridoxamine kinase n=1 Tax=Sporosarcina sp. GW1-11 TaxID=2899126 RepID=UPI00294F6757|nr:pyridoxamine kinase [Sporosarcina sp. GW1-11]MDV6378638.1 pyridoxamine kinase [Sporosarcina sp. GW1-11]